MIGSRKVTTSSYLQCDTVHTRAQRSTAQHSTTCAQQVVGIAVLSDGVKEGHHIIKPAAQSLTVRHNTAYNIQLQGLRVCTLLYLLFQSRNVAASSDLQHSTPHQSTTQHRSPSARAESAVAALQCAAVVLFPLAPVHNHHSAYSSSAQQLTPPFPAWYTAPRHGGGAQVGGGAETQEAHRK